jgi:ATP-dependent Clp protease ATP-binding subunit ClpA
MYERFTDRSRKVMQLANQEAQRFNHEYISTEHILVGLIKEAHGLGATILKNLDIDLRKIRLEVEKRIQPGADSVTFMGRLPHTPRSKKVIELSIAAAREMDHNYVGTEHILLGLVREVEGTAAQILAELGATKEAVEAEYAALTGAATKEDESDAAVLESLLRLKELAVMNQDFQLASKYRDEADALKKRMGEGIKQEDAEAESAHMLRQVSCVLLFHMTGQQTASATLAELRKMLG